MSNNLLQNFINESLESQSSLRVGGIYKINPRELAITTSHHVKILEFYDKNGEQYAEVGILNTNKPPYEGVEVTHSFGMLASFLEKALIPIQ